MDVKLDLARVSPQFLRKRLLARLCRVRSVHDRLAKGGRPQRHGHRPSKRPAARSTRLTSRSNGISPSPLRRPSPSRPATPAPRSPKPGQLRCRLLAFICPRGKARRRRRRPITTCCCPRAGLAGCRSPPCARSRPITSATPAPRPVNGRSPPSTRQRERLECPGGPGVL